MRILDIMGQLEVNDLSTLEVTLQRRTEQGDNAFWLSLDESGYPMLSIVVKEDIAALDYLATDEEPGFKSVGGLSSVDPEGSTVFSISHNRADDLEVQNDSLVPFSVAVEAAREFFSSSERPQCIDWFEL